jgi:hypothetical protein
MARGQDRIGAVESALKSITEKQKDTDSTLKGFASMLSTILSKIESGNVGGNTQSAAHQANLQPPHQASLANQKALALEAWHTHNNAPGAFNSGPETQYPDIRYVRIKPYNPARRFVRKRQYFAEISRVCIGGTGDVGDIPVWYQVPTAMANEMQKYRQIDGDIDSPPVLDIATWEQKCAIDSQEEKYRLAKLGVSAAFDKSRAIKARAHVEHIAEYNPAADLPPTPFAGAEAFSTTSTTESPVQSQSVLPPAPPPLPSQVQQPQPIQSLPKAISGRAAALDVNDSVDYSTADDNVPPAVDLTTMTDQIDMVALASSSSV